MIAPTTHGEKYKKNFDAIYQKLSKKHNLEFIPFLLEDEALNPRLNQADEIHPTQQEAVKISENIQKGIIAVLNEKKNLKLDKLIVYYTFYIYIDKITYHQLT